MFSAWRWTALCAFLMSLAGVASADTTITLEDSAPSASDAPECDDCCNDWCCKEPLLGIIQATDTRWANFISPMTNPVFFEDPRTLSEARLIFAEHHVPSLAGGAIPASDLQVLALQLRAALTENLSLIATKDGYIFASPDSPLDDGWADVSLGLKYNLFKDVESQRILSVGSTYELPIGSRQALQGNGSGEFNLFAAYGQQIGDWNHFLTTAGVRLPTDKSMKTRFRTGRPTWTARLRAAGCTASRKSTGTTG